MKLKIMVSLFLATLNLTCLREVDLVQTDANGVAIQLPHLWKSSLSDGTLGYGLRHGFIYNGGILCVGMRKSTKTQYAQNGEQYLVFKDVNTGQNLWSWDDRIEQQSYFNITKGIAFYEGRMLFYDQKYQYCIDTQTGRTVWKVRRDIEYNPTMSQLGPLFFATAIDEARTGKGLFASSILKGNINSGSIQYISTPTYSREFVSKNSAWVGDVTNVVPVIRDVDTLLIIPHTEMGPEAKFTVNRCFLSLYNLSQHKWMYERAELSRAELGGTTSIMPIVISNRIYVTVLPSVHCFDLMTGKRIWDTLLEQRLTGFSDLIMADNKLLANSLLARLHCLDPQTGAVLWSQKSSAVGSDLYYQDGVVYYIASKNLLAVEVATGKLLWDLPSPDAREEKRSDSWFGGFVTGVPGKNGQKGKIYATTNLNLYCFDAAR